MRRAISSSRAWRLPYRRNCSPPSNPGALTCRASFPQTRACSRCRSIKSRRGAVSEGDRCDRAPRVARAGITRESVTLVRPCRQSSAAPNLHGPLRRIDHAALCSPRAGAVCGSEHAIPWSRASPDLPPRAIMSGAMPARSCAPCSEVSERGTSREIGHCTTIPHKADPLCFSIGLSRSWDGPTPMFADAVDATIVKGGAPAFLLSRKRDFDSADIASDMLRPDRDRALAVPTMSSDNRERGRSSALLLQGRCSLTPDRPTCQTTIGLQKKRVRLAVCMVLRQRPIHRATVCLWRDRLSGGGDELFGHVSHVVDWFCMFECEAG
jgi:hypothetical protein